MSSNGSRMSLVEIEDGCEAFRRKAFGSDRCRQRFLKGTRFLLSTLDARGRTIELDLFKILRAVEWYLQQERSSSEAADQTAKEFASLRAQLVNALVQRNTALVFAMIKRRQVADVDRDDLLSHGLWALLQSVSRFDPWRGFRFSTYACTAIGNSFRLLVRKNHLHKTHIAQFRTIKSRVGDTDERTANADRQIVMERLQQILAENHAELSGVERYVIDRRILGTERRPATLESVGNTLALSKERVRQIQLVGLAKLRVFVAKSDSMSSVI